MLTLEYVTVAAVAVALVFWLIRAARGWNGIAVGAASSLLFACLFMVRARCMRTTGELFHCGFCGFRGGFTWHFAAGLVLALLAWAACAGLLASWTGAYFAQAAELLGRWASPLLGLALANTWEMLPVSVSHPPYVTEPGRCPGLPLLCHDVNLLGYGGLPYWTLPFLLWAAVSVVRHARHWHPRASVRAVTRAV
jgi:hypothetical protein